jgi:hypothetical protein
MALLALGSTAQTYVGKTPANAITSLNNFENTDNTNVSAVQNVGDTTKSDSLTQSVLQSLQNLGLNAADQIDTNTALQPFLQSLYTALSASANPPAPPPPPSFLLPQVVNVGESTDGSIVESSIPTLTTVSGGTNLKYKIDLSEADLGDYLPQVSVSIKNAIENIGKYISSAATLDIKVFTRNADPNTLAEASTTMITATSNGQETIDSSFVSDSMYGVELLSNNPDTSLYINIDRLGEMSFDGKPASNQFDLTSILTHEILHGIAFTGLLGNDSGSELKTGFDQLISTVGGSPVFDGRHAKTANNGRPIPLSPATSGTGSAFYHVAIPNDLMSESIKKGEVKTISALNVAMLEDMGVTVTGVSPNASPKVQTAAYVSVPTPSEAAKNLMDSIQNQNALQTNFDNLVESLGGGSNAADMNLQNFLTQFAANSQQLPPLKNTGSLFSVSA